MPVKKPLLLIIFLSAAILTGCPKPPVARQMFDNPDSVSGNFPRTIAVLPFRNLTSTDGIENIVRVNFYDHLSSKIFSDVELYVIDRKLREHKIFNQDDLAGVPVKKLGMILGADAVVFGNVFEFKRIFAGIYSSISAGASIEIWDTRQCKKIWNDRYISTIQEGGVPISLMDIPMITLRSGYHLREENNIKAIDDLTRHLAARIPAPGNKYGAENKKPEYFLQVGAFSDLKRAEILKKKYAKDGYPAFIRKNYDNRGLWHRVILGPYPGHKKALFIKKQIMEKYGDDCLISLYESR